MNYFLKEAMSLFVLSLVLLLFVQLVCSYFIRKILKSKGYIIHYIYSNVEIANMRELIATEKDASTKLKYNILLWGKLGTVLLAILLLILKYTVFAS